MMGIAIWLLWTLAAIFVASPTFAQQPGHRYVLKNYEYRRVIVWKDDNARSRGLELIQQNVQKTHPELMNPLIACIVLNETPVVLNSVVVLSADITVIDGDNEGCHGIISADDLKELN